MTGSPWCVIHPVLPLEFADCVVHSKQLKKCTSLAYLHILNGPMAPASLRNLHELLLKSLPPAFELLGYDTRLNWVERDCTTGQAVYSAPWDATVAFDGGRLYVRGLGVVAAWPHHRLRWNAQCVQLRRVQLYTSLR